MNVLHSNVFIQYRSGYEPLWLNVDFQSIYGSITVHSGELVWSGKVNQFHLGEVVRIHIIEDFMYRRVYHFTEQSKRSILFWRTFWKWTNFTHIISPRWTGTVWWSEAVHLAEPVRTHGIQILIYKGVY